MTLQALSLLAGAALLLACQAREHQFVPADEYEALAAGDEFSSGADCDDGGERCEGQCRDLDSDPDHCGECGNGCDGGVCVFGSCFACRPGERVCDGACVDVEADGQHCGACGSSCDADELCNAGTCRSACAEGTVDCNGGCVDLALDPRHCGACGNPCDDDRVCSGGNCRLECAPPYVLCDGACRDVRVDASHCGGCGTVCAPMPEGNSTVCLDGECVPTAENCQNGEDDNDDGLRDCEDPSCQAFRCLPRSPAGFSEPFVLQLGEGRADPRCPGAFPQVVISGLHQGLVANPAQCSCECETTAACRVTVWFYDDVACRNEPWELSGSDALASGACEGVHFLLDGSPGGVAIWPETEPERFTSNNTECTLTANEVDPPTWSVDAVGCAAELSSSAGCSGGTCVSRDTDVRYCVAQQGNQGCPEGFPNKQLMHTDFIDDRSCGECGCEFECEDSFLAYTDDDCQVDEQSIPANTPCSSLTPDDTPELDGEDVWETRSFLVEPPRCDPVSKPTGSANAAGSVTVCCEE